MTKILRVISPFFVMETGDTFNWDATKNMYISIHSEEFHKSDDANSEVSSSYNSDFSISAEYASDLIKQGYLEEVSEDETSSTFVNVFDEINRLTVKYTNELKTIDEDMATMPECVKIERITVLKNMLKLLGYLYGLKK